MPPFGRKDVSAGSSHQVGRPRPEIEREVDAPRRLIEPLTPRELEILELIADGLFNREISNRLWLAEETVKTHVHHILTKLDARSRAHAVSIGLRSRLID
jgi:DNA-binding NarL/FixJ family response regulator